MILAIKLFIYAFLRICFLLDKDEHKALRKEAIDSHIKFQRRPY